MKPTIFVGNLGGLLFQKESLGECLKRVYDQNTEKPVVGMFSALKPILVIRDLNVVRNILVMDAHAFLDRPIETKGSTSLGARNLFVLKGKEWRHMRVKLTPTFTSGKMKKMFYLINACGKELLQCIDRDMSKGGRT
ncbi:hypothetical protein PR048_014924 [Dryococelus australis]|uniref:Cytochrome P450 n=1 Tax=Dryococelus australis TaxID=614101 RepID=A0ABQ9HFN7_9NEOP|nr:hypothetical protein PR048_014924 [Dryococelus australis]